MEFQFADTARTVRMRAVAALLGGCAVAFGLVGWNVAESAWLGVAAVSLIFAIPLVLLTIVVSFSVRACRTLSERIARELRSIPRVQRYAHDVDVTILDGRTIRGVGVMFGYFVTPSLGRWEPFDARLVTAVKPALNPTGSSSDP